MATSGNKRHLWKCPRCGSEVTLFVKATEVLCANKVAHTSTSVRMEEKSEAKR